MNDLSIKYDINSMNSLLLNFHNQIDHACELGQTIPELDFDLPPKELFVLGMGGSAIGGDLLKSLVHQLTNDSLRITINRSYDIPEYINNQTLVVASSYSGNTEETLTGFEKASKLTNKLFAITSGGKLEKICKERDIPYLKLPSGFQPRAALAYSLFALVYLVINNNLISNSFNHKMDLAVIELRNTMKKLTD